ncbi:hypothetical protein HTZ77_03160 [Nonomuraea sp. SMC257]|uniref:Uncharacterized protein n=1 Tax=Nonomuraea montanisoli TaxID=2741721 RepID=A0A7Y6I3F5_9ACTN|nr:hypothetical protein [Nonomuraea montanisoli]NUW30428.1 hypothetical protein [Nonomuraea montanisoli]
MTQERTGAGPAPEDESDALLDALGRGEPPPHDDPAARLLAALRADACRDGGMVEDGMSARTWDDGVTRTGDGGASPVGQRRSSVSMTPST